VRPQGRAQGRAREKFKTMNLWDQNVENAIVFMEPQQMIQIFTGNVVYRVLAVQLKSQGTMNNSNVIVACDGPDADVSQFELHDLVGAPEGIVYLNITCTTLTIDNYQSDMFSTIHVFYTNDASGTAMISDATHTAFIENKIDLGDIFTIGFLTIFLSLAIFKFVWDFVHTKIIKNKTINDL
jgi:hypothetical protein